MLPSIQRVRAIIVEAARIVLIERVWEGRRYLVFPGGGVEAGESHHDALVRELREETGLHVHVHDLVATVAFPDQVQGFFRASVVGGEFGAGDGPEYSDPAWVDRGTYRPVWFPVSSLATEPVVPAAVARLVMEAHASGWPDTPLSLIDRSDR